LKELARSDSVRRPAATQIRLNFVIEKTPITLKYG
jgi:hypothetical protein